jgi:LPXTG-site transpeptidase (sortase) family protein
VPSVASSNDRQRRRLPAALTIMRSALIVLAASLVAAATASAGTRPAHQVPIPVRLNIPSIGVSAPIIPLGRNRDGTMELPASFSVAGWFRPGPEPGERGAAVIAGHIASRRGPGVFYRLGSLRRGAKVVVVLRNGSRKQFVVTGQKQVRKASFPTKLVYRRTVDPTLRLVTCGGRFNSATGHHVDNVIVFAKLAGGDPR